MSAARSEGALTPNDSVPAWWPPDPQEVRVVTFNAAAGNPRIKTRQSDFLELPFYRDAFEGVPTAPLLALQEVGSAQARALRRRADATACRVLQARRPGLGNALVVPERYQLLSHRRGYYAVSHLLGVADGLRRWALRQAQPNWRQFGELRMWIEARLLDRASGRELTIFNTHLSVDASLKLTQGREILRRTRSAATGRHVILAGDLNVTAGHAAGPDGELAALLTGLRDMGTSPPPPRKNIDYVLADGFEPVASRIWTGDSLKLPGSPNAETVSDHYPEDDLLRYAGAT